MSRRKERFFFVVCLLCRPPPPPCLYCVSCRCSVVRPPCVHTGRGPPTLSLFLVVVLSCVFVSSLALGHLRCCGCCTLHVCLAPTLTPQCQTMSLWMDVFACCVLIVFCHFVPHSVCVCVCVCVCVWGRSCMASEERMGGCEEAHLSMALRAPTVPVAACIDVCALR